MRPKKIKNILTNFMVVCASILVCFLAVETVLRLTLYNFKTYTKSPGADAIYYIETVEFKTKVRTNSLNMRDYEIPSKTPDEYRVLCLGDSFTFGLGVNVSEAYPKVAEQALRNDLRLISVINGGTEGNAKDAYEFLTDKGLQFQPDLVIVQVYLGNDFYDGMRFLDQESFRDVWKNDVRQNWLSRLKEKLKSFRCCTMEFFWNRLVQIRYFDDLLYRFDLRYDNRGIFLRQYPALEQKLTDLEIENLEKISKVCEENGIQKMVMIVPTKQQLFKKQFLDNDKYNYRKPGEIIKEFCQKHHIAYVDFLGLYEDLPEKLVRSFYYNQDRHWTIQGHAYAGQILADFIFSHGRSSSEI